MRRLKLLSLSLITACLPALATADDVLNEVVAGDWRKAEDSARDSARHPVESLTFWGLKPGAAILEVQPGGGWWTDILAPYAARTGGRYASTGADLQDPELSEQARAGREAMARKFTDNAELYGKVDILDWGPRAAPLPENQFDLVLVSRGFHGWMRADGMVERYLGQLHATLKPGGVLAIEQHRANPGEQDPKAASGYVTEEYLIAQVEKAGFKLDGKSEVNANPKDTKDHPFGVWTLPPTRMNAPYGSTEPPDPNFDRARYDAIGESDRMTLRFVKPE
jgi:predicted methyltransferase